MPLDPGSNSITEFHAKLQSLRRILALCGADLSELSGLSTYLGPGATLGSSREPGIQRRKSGTFTGHYSIYDVSMPRGADPRSAKISTIRCVRHSRRRLRTFEDLLHVPILDLGQEVVRVPLKDITAWIDSEPVDLILVIGTTAMVWPAAGFVIQARNQDTALTV